MFYAVQALLAVDGVSFSKHGQAEAGTENILKLTRINNLCKSALIRVPNIFSINRFYSLFKL
jgi:uncharacterized protein (UPF0332 family)